MKKIVFFVLLSMPLLAFAQLFENFNDGLFKSEPPSVSRKVQWTGNEAHFMVNANLQLQLNASGAESPVYLRTNNVLTNNACWEWWMKMDFNPTSSNYARIYLCSDENDLTGELNGLFVRAGHTKKNIALIQSQKGKSNKTLIEGLEKRIDKASVAFQLKVTLDKYGNLCLYSKLEDETEYTVEGSCVFPDKPVGQSFGVVCNFTSTRAKSFYFDDFLIRELTDDEQGSENPTPDPEPDPEPKPEPEPEPGDIPEYGDIIFSEIMANPGDDGVEYLEFYNQSGKTFQLKNLLYYYGDKAYKLPEGKINPQTYFVLCKTTTTNSFPQGVNAYGVGSFPTIANSGKLLMLGTSDEKLISWFEYSDKMYGENEKKAGGWSLECIDFTNLSNTASNWSGSVSPGGTPGKINSIKNTNPDTEQPKITGSETLENNTLRVLFSKPMNVKSLSDVKSYQFENSNYSVRSVTADYPKGMSVELALNRYPEPGEMIGLNLPGIRDLSGFDLGTDQALMVGEGHEASANDLVINEILFNPPTGGNEYVEIYNRSDKAYDLRLLSISSRKPSDGSLNKPYPLSSFPLLIEPGEYLLITKNRNLVCEFFECREELFFVEPESMPSLANASGCAVLLNGRTGEVVDEFAYNEKMHAPGISNKKGVALERVDTEKPSDDPDNWHSAAAETGYGTPGYANSQHSGTSIPSGLEEPIGIIYPSFETEPYEIYYKLDAPGYRCNAYIFDSMGRQISRIASNQLLGVEGKLNWNGKGASGSSLTSGIYIVYIEIYHTEGKVQKYRKPVVIK